jgi:hypothetical protein
MRLAYVLSDRFDYQRTIVPDRGPVFAEDYGWTSLSLVDAKTTDFDVAVIDQRLLPEELDGLQRLIAEKKKATFVFRLCDPYWEYSKNHWWYRFVSDSIDQPRLHVMLNYQPAEITALFASKARRSQFILAPYVYRPEMELPLNHEDRRHSILFSGAMHRWQYPIRWRMGQAGKWWPPLRRMRASLPHPGYPDLTGAPAKHGLVGSQYLRELARFRFASVCSSRCRLEFLKYREFAYAGVVPVGDLPATLLDCPDEAWVPWRRNFVALTKYLRRMTDTETRAQAFRNFMRERRDVNAMRSMVAQKLERLA